MKEDKPCPSCAKGTMKYKPAAEPLLAEVPRVKPAQAKCDNCDYEDDYEKF